MRREDIVLLDGAIGTGLWEKADDKVPVWRYNIENPAIVKELAREYAEAGSQIIHTNTFSANRITLQRASALRSRKLSETGQRHLWISDRFPC